MGVPIDGESIHSATRRSDSQSTAVTVAADGACVGAGSVTAAGVAWAIPAAPKGDINAAASTAAVAARRALFPAVGRRPKRTSSVRMVVTLFLLLLAEVA